MNMKLTTSDTLSCIHIYGIGLYAVYMWPCCMVVMPPHPHT